MPQLCPILNKTDEAILAILRSNHREEFVSGAEIAAELGIGRLGGKQNCDSAAP